MRLSPILKNTFSVSSGVLFGQVAGALLTILYAGILSSEDFTSSITISASLSVVVTLTGFGLGNAILFERNEHVRSILSVLVFLTTIVIFLGAVFFAFSFFWPTLSKGQIRALIAISLLTTASTRSLEGNLLAEQKYLAKRNFDFISLSLGLVIKVGILIYIPTILGFYYSLVISQIITILIAVMFSNTNRWMSVLTSKKIMGKSIEVIAEKKNYIIELFPLKYFTSSIQKLPIFFLSTYSPVLLPVYSLLTKLAVIPITNIIVPFLKVALPGRTTIEEMKYLSNKWFTVVFIGMFVLCSIFMLIAMQFLIAFFMEKYPFSYDILFFVAMNFMYMISTNIVFFVASKIGQGKLVLKYQASWGILFFMIYACSSYFKVHLGIYLYLTGVSMLIMAYFARKVIIYMISK